MRGAALPDTETAETTARPRGRGPGRPSREVIEQRNRALLEQALDMFLDNGFEATTIDGICHALGMSRRTIYARYGDKEALFQTAMQLAIDQYIVPVERLREAECESLEETLLAIARLWVANIRKPSGWRLARLANTEAHRRPEVAAYLYEQTAQATIGYMTDLFRRRLRPGTEAGDAADAAAAFLILIVEGSVQLAIWDRMPEAEFDRQLVYRTRLFLRGALANPSGADPMA